MTINTVIQKRARRKFLTYPFIYAMLKLDSPMKKSYWNTWHCCREVYSDQESAKTGRYLSKYCKNRWCLVCASIRTAVLINTYRPILSNWEDKCFLTLTIKNCVVEILREKIQEMNKVFYDAVRVDRKKKDSLKIKCVKKMEVTYNLENKDYHPHFHVITENFKQAEFLVNYWLEHFKKDLEAIKKCQDIEGADDNSMIELFKYFTKIVTKKKAIPPENLNEIFIAIRQMHTVRPFGFQVLLPEDEEEIEFNLESKEMSELNIYGWEQDLHDWVSQVTGEKLSGYVPSERAKKWVEQFELSQ
jgi:hypothetical protein